MRRLLIAFGIVGTVLVAQLAGWLLPLDLGLRDLRFRLDHRQPTQQIAFVDVDPASLDAVGVWPWPRETHAELLTRLLDLGAAEVAFDIDFSTPSRDPAGDQAFEDALADAGGYAILPGFLQMDSGQLTLPLPRFAQHAQLGAVNVATDNTGIVRSLPYGIGGGGTPLASLPNMLAGKPVLPGSFVLDYAIDANAIDRILAKDVLAGNVDPARVADRKIVIGASALELRDVMMTPTQGPQPGAIIQIIAAESLLQGRALPPANPLINGLVVLAVFGALLVLRPQLTQWRGAASALTLMAAVEIVALAIHKGPGILIDTAAVHVLIVVALVVSTAAESARRRSKHIEALQRLARLATYDTVTGVLTRQAFIDRAGEAIGADKSAGIVCIGLDRFEAIAATLGQRHADAALREIAGRMSLPEVLAIGRVGGERFALLTAAEDAAALARRMRAMLDAPLVTGGHRIVLSVSAGHARSDDDDAGAAEALLNRAELAQSAARTAHAPTPIAYHREMQQAFEEERALEVDLRDAIASGSIDVFAQGQYDLATGMLCGAEALARWRHPRLGQVSPVRFVPIAEQSGLAPALGRHMLESACKSAAHWPDGVRLAVNVSPAQLEFDDMPHVLDRALKQSGLDPRRLDIEITEGMVLRAHRGTLDVLERIRGMGVGIALDDFGTGYSSLSYLSSLPITKLKIDQSFVRGLFTDSRADAVAQTILELCARLDLPVVAEGVETKEQADWLRERGCAVAQGYLFHRPAPIAELPTAGTSREQRDVEALAS